MDRYGQFKNLYKKFVNGTLWLNAQAGKGVDITRHKQDFEEKVVKPMDEIWATFSPKEKADWERVNRIVKMFGGRIV